MPDFKRTTVELDEEKLDKFKAIFPQHGAMKWFLDSCLDEFLKKAEFLKIQDSINVALKDSVSTAITRMEEGGDSRDGKD